MSAPEVEVDRRGAGESRRLTRTQRTVARRMVEATQGVPAFRVAADVDLGAAEALRAELKAVGEERAPSLNDMIVRACALALVEHRTLNASFDAEHGALRLWDHVNVGVAVATGDALIVPTIVDADVKPLAEIARETRALAAAVRDGTIAPAALADGTFTVSNLGMLGVRHFDAVINPPQAAILAVGGVRDVLRLRDGAVVVGREATLTLTCDHRIVYGADAARFLATVAAGLQDGERLRG
jgi:pyruvate dehydrogenase E2 component (dihydrolipoamide acetyltransferase)